MEKKVLFAINTYDSDGDVVEYGVFLHFGDTSIKVAKDLDEYRQFLEQINGMTDELTDAYESAK